MKKKVKIGLFVFIVIGVVVLNITYKNKNEVIKTKRKRQGNLAIVVKDANGVETNSDSIPIGNYKINEEKTHCENNGKILSYDNTTGKISFSFIGSDRCYLYFDVIADTEKPVITDLTINGAIVTATLTDNLELSGYGISTSNTVEPISWTSISGTSYNLSTTITTEGTYYIWVKDSSDNKIVSAVIDIKIYGWNTILLNSKVNETTPNFKKIAKTNEGLFKAQDDLGTSYYFRGAVNNNWVKFGKDSSGNAIYWRIIRINGDGSIRMIYSGITAPTSSTAIVMTGEGTQISKGAFNSSYSDPSYVGYMYTVGQQHGNGTSSTIKMVLENWYKTTTLETDSSTKALVSQDQIFCNDRSVSSGSWSSSTSTSNKFYYATDTRLSTNPSPILTCPTESDKFTSKKSGIGNKKLEYPIGLITMDEVAMAGGVNTNDNTKFYLVTNEYYWSGSPGSFNGDYDGANEFHLYSSGDLGTYHMNSTYGIRPVISLSSSVKLSGDGTWNNVYTVS